MAFITTVKEWEPNQRKRNIRVLKSTPSEKASRANANNLTEKAEELGEVTRCHPPPSLKYPKKSPRKQKNLHISCCCVFDSPARSHRTPARSAQLQASLHTSVWETVCSFQTRPCPTSKGSLQNFKLHQRQSEDEKRMSPDLGLV